MSKKDLVNHPEHYTKGGIEVIDFIEAKELNYHLGNVIKYVSRAGHKADRLEDLQKAHWYLIREIMREQDKQGVKKNSLVSAAEHISDSEEEF